LLADGALNYTVKLCARVPWFLLGNSNPRQVKLLQCSRTLPNRAFSTT
jgi:hypothetical protein